MVRQGFSTKELDELDFWRYETYVEKTIEWFDAIKNAKENQETAKDGKKKLFEIIANKPPEEWTHLE